MQSKNQKITLASYLDLVQLLKVYQGNHETNRLFSLNHDAPEIEQLQQWKNEKLYHLQGELDSSKYLHYLSLFTYVFSFLFLLFGLLAGFTLLSYSGKEPVNIIYLLFVMVGLPIFSMLLSLLSMYTGNVGANFFNHFSPLYYLQKMINFFYFSKKVDLSNISFPPALGKWIFLHRLQLFSFLFALGLFISLVFTVISKDLAFAWSSTLEINPLAFQNTLAYLATPWQSFFPSAVPTLELVEVSHYYRLGEKLDVTMVQNADKLGAWWKFLAMAMLVYALALRLLLWLWIHLATKRALQKELLATPAVKQLLFEFSTPYVSTQAQNSEQHLELSSSELSTPHGVFAMEYETLLGWNYSQESLILVQDFFNVNAKDLQVVGGKNSYQEDQEVMATLNQSVLLYVKAWEPPTMDFMDFLEELLEKPELFKVDVCPLGTATTEYASQNADLYVWLKKLEQIESTKLGVIDV